MVLSSIFILRGEGQGEIESGTPSQLGSGPDTSTMFFNQPFGNGEPQTCSAVFTTFHLIEFIEDHEELILWDAHAGISNLKESGLVLLARGDEDLTSIVSKFERIGK
jgi:hypothetical protein